MFKYYAKAIKNYANFQGRATRAEFWWFQVVNLCVFAIFAILIIISMIYTARALFALVSNSATNTTTFSGTTISVSATRLGETGPLAETVSSINTTPTSGIHTILSVILSIVMPLYTMFIIIPTYAVTVRRLHDTGKSGWWVFVSFIPFIGVLWHFITLVTDSGPDNQYGPNPKLQGEQIS